MARKTTTLTTVVESFTQKEVPEEAVEEVILTVGEAAWRLDLTEASRMKLEEVLQPFTKHEEAVPVASLRRKASPQFPPEYLAKVREWAWEQGMDVAPKGLVAKAVREAYDAHLAKGAEEGSQASTTNGTRKK